MSIETIRLNSAREAEIATEFSGDGTTFKVGDVARHDHIKGRFYASTLIEIKLYICDASGTAKQTRNLWSGSDVKRADEVFYATALVVECAAKTKVLRAVWLENNRAIRSHSNVEA
jgi:hypothetical protein